MADKSAIEWTDAPPSPWNKACCGYGPCSKKCGKCQELKPLTDFAVDRTRADGRTYICRACRNGGQRSKYQRRGRQRSGPAPAPARDGDKRQARATVNHLVATAKFVPPGDLKCVDCGHRGPDRRHEYDHHLGYAPEHHRDVQPVCTVCHRKRAIARGEWRRGR